MGPTQFFRLFIVFGVGLAVTTAIKCRMCGSEDTPNCASQPLLVKGDCDGDKCYSYVDGTITKRGCTAPTDGCDGVKCKECEKEFCNNDIVPADRRLCFQCEGLEKCTATSSLTALACQNYKAEDKCFTYVSDDKRVVRGCESDNFETCGSDKKNCFDCGSDGCNKEPAISQATCFDCSSRDTKNCKRPANVGDNCTLAESTQKCNFEVLLGRDPQCFTDIQGEIVRRGCGNDNGRATKTCGKANCNSDCVTDATCYACDASQCKSDDLGKSTKCGEYVTSCNHCEKEDGSSTIRGCGGDPPANFICKSCVGVNCNKEAKLPKMCYICDSKTNPDCAENVGIESKFCEDVTHQCMVKLGDDGLTTRSCAPKSECEDNNPKCAICDKHLCNTQVLVKDVTKCFQCSESESCAADQIAAKANATNCLKAGDQCYMFSKDGKVVQRGCMSDPKRPDECDKGDDECLICNKDNCNSLPLSGKPGLSCIQCTRNETECPWRHLADNAKECATEILYYQQELCYTYQYPGGRVERGCLSENKDCTLHSKNCRVCYESGCNIQSTRSWSCIQCRSDVYGQEACKNVNPNIPKTECYHAPTAETQGCFTKNYGGVIIRGCLSNLDAMDFKACQNDDKCKTCPLENCNDQKPPSRSTSVTASTFTTAFIVFLSLKLF